MDIKKIILYLSLLIPITLLAGSNIIETKKAIMEHEFNKKVSEKKVFLGKTHMEKTITVSITCKVIILMPKIAGPKLTLQAADAEMNICFRENTGYDAPYQSYEDEDDDIITEDERKWVKMFQRKF